MAPLNYHHTGTDTNYFSQYNINAYDTHIQAYEILHSIINSKVKIVRLFEWWITLWTKYNNMLKEKLGGKTSEALYKPI